MSSSRRFLLSRVFHYFWRQWCDDLTPAGKIVFWGICVTGLGTIELQMPIYQLFFGLVALIGIGATAGAVFRPRVLIEGDFPDRAAAGQATTTLIGLTNLRRIPAYDVGANILGLPPTFETNLDENLVSRLGARQRILVPVTLTASRRGRYELPPLRAYSNFPFSLGRSGKTALPLAPLLVTPGFEPLAGLRLPVSHRHHAGGTTLVNQTGQSAEYIGNREYVPGEPVRRLDFRAWARLGKPVVREYHEEFHSRVALILDTQPIGFAGRKDEESPLFEAAVSLAAALANELVRQEYLIELFATGDQWHAFEKRSRAGRFDEIMGLLAEAQPRKQTPFQEISPRWFAELADLSSAVVVLVAWNETRKDLIEKMELRGCQVKTILVVAEHRKNTIPVGEIPNVTVLEIAEIERGGLSLH